MFEKLPSLRGFQPKFYSGGATRFHLPLACDLVAQTKPKRVAIVGFGEGDVFFTFSQAAMEQKIDCECIAVRRDRAGESEEDDAGWREGRLEGEEFYGERVHFFASEEESLAATTDRSIDILWIDDSDSGSEIRRDLAAWEPKLSADAIVLLHGLQLERGDSPGAAWHKWVGKRAHANFPEGIGVGIALGNKSSPASFFTKHSADLATLYSITAARIDATARATNAEKAAATFETRQV